MWRAFLLVVVTLSVFGCGSNLDNVSGNATLTNGTVQGTATVQTPFGPLTFGNLASPSPFTYGQVSPSPSPMTSPSP